MAVVSHVSYANKRMEHKNSRRGERNLEENSTTTANRMWNVEEKQKTRTSVILGDDRAHNTETKAEILRTSSNSGQKPTKKIFHYLVELKTHSGE